MVSNYSKGISGTWGTRYEGVSAIEKSMHVITAIQELEKVRNARISDPLYDNVPIPVPVNIGTISGERGLRQLQIVSS